MADHDDVSSAPIELRLKWDVFLSFRGEDTRTTFIEHLYTSLYAAKVRVFRDNEGMNRGDEIGPSLLGAIEDSAVAIAVISRCYASSHWCLEELAKLCECKKLILPVFYGVNPSDVRHQRWPFAEGFEAHASRFPIERIESWRKAMRKVGGISGWVVSNIDNQGVDRDQQLLIEILVKEILKLLTRTPMAVPQFMAGLDSHSTTHLFRVLEAESPNHVKILGLHGMGGVGKTTLAKAIFNKLVAEFEFRGFISDIRKVSAEDNGLLTLQNKLISSLTNSKVAVKEISEGRRAIKRTVEERPVLVVLDDVDDENQLDALIGNKEWFHSGSRILITTRETQVLLRRRSDIELYEVRELGFDDALKLFSFHALKRETSTGGHFAGISRQIVSLMGGLPLSLEVFGCFLADKRRMEEWESALQRLKEGLPNDVYRALKISYDGLEERDRSIFLDIACLFLNSGMTRHEAVDILDGCGYDAETAIKTLTHKSLVKVRDDDSLSVHDQLREMGREIVLSGNLGDPGKCSRLWDRREILSVLRDGKGTRNVQGIALDYKVKMPIMDPTDVRILWINFMRMPALSTLATFLHEIYKKFVGRKDDNGMILNTVYFRQMINLRLLQINLVKLEGKFKLLPQSIKWLQWRGSPLKVVPSDFCPSDLAVLDLTDSDSLERLWNNNKVGGNLKIINLRGCANLQVTPNLSGSPKLEKLILERCVSLTELHHSIGSFSSLRYLNLSNCSKLTTLPSDVSGLKHLESLILSGCGNLKVLPENLGNLTSLKELLLGQTALTELPESLFRLEKLEKLDLTGCSSLKLLTGRIGLLGSLKELILNGTGIDTIPDSIKSLENLEELSLRWCASLTAIPDTIGGLRSLRHLVTDGSQVETLPCSVAALPYLRTLSVGNCRLPSNFLASDDGGLNSLVELQLGGPSITILPDQIGALKMLKRLEVRDCPSLESLPESLGSLFSLTTLIITNVMIKELPKSIGDLEDLSLMALKKCSQLHRLPDSFGRLKSLHHLWMEESGVVELPKRFGNLSNLVTLQMGKNPRSSQSQSLGTQVTLPISFSNLISLQELNARACRISGRIPDDFENLVLLSKLDLSYNNFSSLPSSMKGLSHLKNLILCHCTELTSLPPLPLRLENIDIKGCRAMESISDLSELESLEELNMANCEKVKRVEGIQCLKSLRRLYMTGCNACSMVVKRQFSKVSLRNMRVLGMPGDKIPEWLHEEEVTYKPCPNRELKAILIAVVVSTNHDFPEDLKDIPELVDIQAKILRQQGELQFATALPLKGIAKVNEEQVHFCRFLDFHPLVSMLRDGYKVRVEIRNPPMIRGTELKKCGVHLVFDDEDDYGGDEEALEEREQSLSEKLARFLNS